MTGCPVPLNQKLIGWNPDICPPVVVNNWTCPPVVVQLLIHVQLCDPMDYSMPGFLSFIISQNLLKLMSIESVMPSNHFVFCHLFLLLPLIFSSIRDFSNELALHIRWPKYWSLSISPFKEYSLLISFRIYLIAVPGTLKRLLLHHSLKAWILWCSAFVMVQLLRPYMTMDCLYFSQQS